jgi:hypothetical protein
MVFLFFYFHIQSGVGMKASQGRLDGTAMGNIGIIFFAAAWSQDA